MKGSRCDNYVKVRWSLIRGIVVKSANSKSGVVLHDLLEGRALLTYRYREHAATGSSSEDSNRLFKISKGHLLVAKSWYIVKNVALKRSFLDGPSMSVMTPETRPSRFAVIGLDSLCSWGYCAKSTTARTVDGPDDCQIKQMRRVQSSLVFQQGHVTQAGHLGQCSSYS